MSSINGHRSLLQELERTEIVLNRLLKKISNISEFLRPLEHSLRAEDFSSSGSYVPGTSNGIVCVLSSLIKGDPLSSSLDLIRGRGLKLPAIIKGSDRSETKSTCDSILKIIEGKPDGTPIDYVINLRWANLPSIINDTNVVVIGNRYNYRKKEALKKLHIRFKELGLQVLEDAGQFGGGPLTYRLTELARKRGNMTVLEITLSHSIAGNQDRVAEILESLTIL
ncbi:MAG: hypothetical protein KAU48_11850 [Candidatus Thorarchaeota archaeon]|nr:hypothetical protein [Candidatus Thorarchaeota archaeon]